MAENPAPQRPEQPSPASSTPPTPPQTETKLDWRLVVIVAMAVLFLIAVYVNKKWYSKSAAEPTPPKEAAARENAEPSTPPLSLAERYAALLHVREMEIESEMFTEDGKTLLLALPAIPTTSKETVKEPDMVIPGTLFDVTKLAEGVKPEMLQRRMVYGANQALFMDMFPPLGLDGHVEMIVKPAAAVTMDVLADSQSVIGVKVGTEARAYPIKLMNYHDVINDTLGGEPIVVVWSALAVAPSAMVRTPDPQTTGDQRPLAFGSAGLVFQGAIVMYSKDSVPAADGKKVEKFSLWSPTLRLCITGERAGARLTPIQANWVTWKTWRTLHPETTVLAGTKPLQNFNYDANMAVPQGYLDPNNPMILHPVYGLDVEKNPLFPKALVFGITDSQGKTAKAYLVDFLREKREPFEDTVGDRKLTLQFDPDALMLSAKDAQGKPVLTEAMLWISWLGAHPKTEVWQEDRLRALRAGQTAPAGPSAPATTAAPVPAVTPEPAPAASTPASSMPATTGAPADSAR